MRPGGRQASTVVGIAVFSHWILDLLVHRPDLPLYNDSAKVGLGLWNFPAFAFGMESALLFGGLWFCLRGRLAHLRGTMAFGIVMVVIQAYIFFGPPPSSDRELALTALISYAVFASAIWWLQDRRPVKAGL